MKKNKAPSIVTLAVLTLITVVFWIFFSVLRLFSTKPSVSVPDEILAPINPTLDTKTLNSLQQRYYLESGQIPEFQYTTSTSQTTPATQSPIVVEETPSPELTPQASASPEASPSAQGEL